MKKRAVMLFFALCIPVYEHVAAALITHYTYDHAGRLIQVEYNNGSRVDYVYDANGNLILRDVESATHVQLLYTATRGGSVAGAAVQVMEKGGNAAPVTAMTNPYFQFAEWSDGHIGAHRADSNVTSNRAVIAHFYAILAPRGTPHWWLAAHGYTNQFDAAELSDDDEDGDPAWKEFITDTNPTHAASYFRVENFGTDLTVHFESSAGRVYTLQGTFGLPGEGWLNVPGAGPRMGVGGADRLQDTNQPRAGTSYRLSVQLP